MNKKDNPIRVYAIVSQIGFLVVVPLVVFIWGGGWLIEKFSLPDFLMVVFVLAGIIAMISGTGTYIMKLIKMYDTDKKEDYKLYSDPKDNDYYDDKG